MLCCYRSEDFQPDSPLYRSLMNLNRQRLLETVQVKDLSKQKTVELIKRTFGEQTISSEFSDLIHGRTGGNPFFIEEVLRSLVEDGTIFRSESKWDRKPIQEIVLPESVKSVLKSRLTKLQTETLNVLTMASVVGSEFDFQVLREVTQTQEDTLLERLEESINAGLISEVPNRKDVFRFADNRIRELLLGDLIRSRRSRYNIKIAEAMEKVYSRNLENQAESIAAQFSEGADIERTIKYSIMAGDRNRAIHAYDSAIADYKRASDLIEREEGREGEKAGVLAKLGDCCNLAGRAEESVSHYQQSLSLYERLRDFKACARISVDLTWALFRAKPTGAQDGVALLRWALKYVETDPESYEAAQIYSTLASWLSELEPETGEAVSLADRALRAGEKSGNFAAIVLTLTTKASFRWDSGQIDEGLELYEKALDLALEHKLHVLAANVLLNLTGGTYSRDFAKGRRLALQMLDISKREQIIPTRVGSYVWLSYLDWLKGDWSLAFDEVNRTLEMAERLGLTGGDMTLAGEVWRALILLGKGDLNQAEKCLENSNAKRNPAIHHVVNLNLALGKLVMEQGREDDAKAYFETCVNAFRKSEFHPLQPQQIETLLHLTSIYSKQGKLDEARRTSEWAKRLAETLKGDACFALASQAEASLMIASGDSESADEAYLKCLDLWERAGWPYYHAKALVAYCEAIAQNKPDESRRRLTQALEIFKRLGAKRDLEKAQARLSVK
jgi:tetratricopeptide (TPR) repeat protein